MTETIQQGVTAAVKTEKNRWKEEKGKIYGYLTVLKKVANHTKTRDAMWECMCKCGSLTKVKGSSLRLGVTVSCGCKKKEYTHMTKHDMCNTRFYACWSDMKRRCKKTGNNKHRYFDRGIKVCERWLSFDFFKEDMHELYNESLTLERINNNKGYHPSNCKWATRQEQAENRETNVYIEFNGKRMSISKWSRELGIPQSTVFSRIHIQGMSPLKALRLT
jgi:hypothetical protein